MKTKYSTTAKTYTKEHWFLPEPWENEDAGAYIGRMAKFARQCFGLTQKQIADHSGFSQMYISRLENGRWNSIKKANRYLRGFGLSIGEFKFKR